MSTVIEQLEPGDAGKAPKRKGFVRKLLRDRPQATVGVVLVAVMSFVAVFAPWLAPYSPSDVGPLRAPPSAAHWLGTDNGGHDMLTLIMYGILVSLIVGVVAAALSMLIGSVGIAAGYFGGHVDGVVTPVTTFFLVIPELILMVILAKLIGSGLLVITLVIGLLLWPSTALIVRAQVKTVRERVYVRRARSIGSSHGRIIFRHVLPQVVPMLLASAVLSISVAIFDETFLAFLGLGDPATISLGKLIENAFESGATSRGEWWMVVPPGVAVTLLILGFTLFGQALEDALNPRLKVSYLSPRSWRIRRQLADAKEQA